MAFLQRGDRIKPEWPHDEHGEPVPPALLTVADSRALENEIIINMLKAYDVPTVTTLPSESLISKLYVGVPAYGIPIFVPETLLGDAKALLDENSPDDESGDGEELA